MIPEYITAIKRIIKLKKFPTLYSRVVCFFANHRLTPIININVNTIIINIDNNPPNKVGNFTTPIETNRLCKRF